MNIKTLQEFYNDWSAEYNCYPAERLETDEWLKQLFQVVLESGQHYGDCVGENISCQLCELTALLNDYKLYLDEVHPYRNRKNKTNN